MGAEDRCPGLCVDSLFGMGYAVCNKGEGRSVPEADMHQLTRQTAVLAFQFGDGISNTFWFTNGTLLIYLSLGKVPLKSWYKFILPLHGLFLILQLIFLFVAVQIGYGPF